jgi:Queuosine biosynthesis protein
MRPESAPFPYKTSQKQRWILGLFMLVSALMGREWMQAAYAHAIAERYRFYSYGDASLLLPGE